MFVRELRKMPAVLSPEEVARLLEAAPGPKAALSAAYAAGLRVSEVVSLKVSDIDSERMQIEQGKGRKDRVRCSRQSYWSCCATGVASPDRCGCASHCQHRYHAGYNLNIMSTDGSRETIPLRWGVRAVLF